MRYDFPSSSRRFVQTNNSDAFIDANLLHTKNIDLTTEPGQLMVAPRLNINTSSSDDAQLGVPVGFTYNDRDAKYYALCGDYVFKTASNDPEGAWSQDAATGTPTADVLYSDITMFENIIYVTTATDIAVLDIDSSPNWDATWWTSTKSATALASTRPHPMEVAVVGSPLLCIGDGNTMHTITSGLTITEDRLTFKKNEVVVWIASGTSRVYIGTVTTTGNAASVYEWDGGDTVATRRYNIKCAGSLAGVVLDDVLYHINSNGELQVLSGAGFQTINRFPISRRQMPIDNSSFIYSNRRFIHPNGMISYKGKILMNVSMQEDQSSAGLGTLDERNPSGIWEFDPETRSLNHKYSYSLDKTGAVDFGQTAIPIDSSADNRVPGALYETTFKKYNTPLLAGASVWTDNATTYLTAIYDLDVDRSQANRGIVTFTRVYAKELQETLADIFMSYKKMLSSSDRVIAKYRTFENANLPVVGAVTWSDGDTFTTTASGFANIVAGDEVEVIMGNGSGTTAHISSISEAGGTYTVNLDETITGVSATDTGYVRADNWKKIESFNDQLKTFRKLGVLADASVWVQVRLELRSNSGTSPAIEQTSIITTEHSQ